MRNTDPVIREYILYNISHKEVTGMHVCGENLLLKFRIRLKEPLRICEGLMLPDMLYQSRVLDINRL